TRAHRVLAPISTQGADTTQSEPPAIDPLENTIGAERKIGFNRLLPVSLLRWSDNIPAFHELKARLGDMPFGLRSKLAPYAQAIHGCQIHADAHTPGAE